MKSEKITIRKPVFITMAVLYIAIIVLGLAAPEWSPLVRPLSWNSPAESSAPCMIC